MRRRDHHPARVELLRWPESGQAADGSVASRQSALVVLPRSELDRLWTPEYLERLARTYWRFLTRISLGLLRVLYTPTSREVVFLGRPIVLLRFHAPEYEIEAERGAVTWRIDRGLLVAPPGRGKGYLRISVGRLPCGEDDREVAVEVTSEVASFYPMIAVLGPNVHGNWFSRVGLALYRVTQQRMHRIVTHAFLRSLARLDLAPSVVGALRPRPELAPDTATGAGGSQAG